MYDATLPATLWTGGTKRDASFRRSIRPELMRRKRREVLRTWEPAFTTTNGRSWLSLKMKRRSAAKRSDVSPRVLLSGRLYSCSLAPYFSGGKFDQDGRRWSDSSLVRDCFCPEP